MSPTSLMGPSSPSGSYSLLPAATFTCTYLFTFLWYLFNCTRLGANISQVYYSITFSCLVHFLFFTIRVVLACCAPPANRVPSLLAIQEILLNTGFLFLLYPAYILLLKLGKFTQATSGLPSSSSLLLNLLRIRPLFRFVLLTGAVLRIMAISHVHSNSRRVWAPETIRMLDETSNVIFSVLAGVVVLLVVDYLRITRHSPTLVSPPTSSALLSHPLPPDSDPNSFSHTPFIVLLISLLLLFRQAFATATAYRSSSSSPAVSEQLWYTFIAMPELTSIALFSWPGLETPHVYRTVESMDEDRSDSESSFEGQS